MWDLRESNPVLLFFRQPRAPATPKPHLLLRDPEESRTPDLPGFNRTLSATTELQDHCPEGLSRLRRDDDESDLAVVL